MSGDTADISSLCEFEWFQWVLYRDEKAGYPDEAKELGRYLGPAKSIGPEMCMHILKPNGRVIQRTTVGPLTPAETNSDGYKEKMRNFMHAIYGGALGTAMTEDESKESGDSGAPLHITPTFEPYAPADRGQEPTIPDGST